jgi:hypothetical protein
MAKIDLDEIEASLGYLEDWKKVLAELRAAREVVEAARDALDDMDRMFRTTERLEAVLKKLDEARRG